MTTVNHDYYKYLSLVLKNKKLFLLIAFAIMTGAVIISYLLPKKYEAKSTVFIEKNVISDLVKGIAVTPSMDDSLKTLTYALNSRTLLLKVINEVDFNLKTKSDAEIEQLLKEIQKNIDIKVNEKDLFVISFKYPNPRVARDFVNTLVRSYIEENVSSKREESFGASKFLSEQISTFKERVDKADSSINQFKSSKGSVANIDEGRLLQEIGSAQQKLYDLQLRRRMLEEQKGLFNTVGDPQQVKLAALQKRLAELRVDYTDNYPEVINIKAQIASLREEIKARKGGESLPPDQQEMWKIDAELKAVKENEANLQQYIAQNRQLLNSIPSAKAALEKLEAEKTNQKNMYDLLYLRQNQSELSKQMELQDKSTTFRIVDPAVTPVYPVSPNRRVIILMGIAAGLGGGLGLLLLRDNLSNAVSMVDSLKGFGLPVLAVIPLIKSEQEIREEKKRDIRIYMMSGIYFSLILSVLLMEVFGITLLDDLVSRLYLPQLVSKFLARF